MRRVQRNRRVEQPCFDAPANGRTQEPFDDRRGVKDDPRGLRSARRAAAVDADGET